LGLIALRRLIGIQRLLELPPFVSGKSWTNTTTTTPVHIAHPSAYNRSATRPSGSVVTDD
jgi:hypothetical protein